MHVSLVPHQIGFSLIIPDLLSLSRSLFIFLCRISCLARTRPLDHLVLPLLFIPSSSTCGALIHLLFSLAFQISLPNSMSCHCNFYSHFLLSIAHLYRPLFFCMCTVYVSRSLLRVRRASHQRVAAASMNCAQKTFSITW